MDVFHFTSPLPPGFLRSTAVISGTAVLCKNAAAPNITFIGASSTAPHIFTYTINGGSNQTITLSGGNKVNSSVRPDNAGIFTYALVSIEDASLTNQTIIIEPDF